MNLKFQQVDWDDKDLMYVEFITDGQKMRWYPKWNEIDDILHCAFNVSRWRDYFDIICSEILLKGLLYRLANKPACAPNLPETDVIVSQLFQTLRNAFVKGGNRASP